MSADPAARHLIPTDLFGTLELPADPLARAPDALVLARVRALVNGAIAPATLRAYRTGWAQWCAYCAQHGYAPLAGKPERVSFFLADLSRTRRPATVQARLAAIAAAHRVAGIELDTRHRLITAVLRGFRREQSARPTRQAMPLLFEVLPRFLATFDRCTAAGARDQALLLVGFGAALRRSELVALDLADVEVVAQGLVVTLRRSKTDQGGSGALLAIHRGSHPELCPVRAFEAWRAIRGAAAGPLFSRIRKGGQVTTARLSDQTVARTLKHAATLLGLSSKDFSGHSLRAGLATSAALAGADLAAIMEQTRHRSADVARRYIRNAEIWRNNVTERLFRAEPTPAQQSDGEPGNISRP
jgi:integrase